MIEELTIDSSVIVASLLENEKDHLKALSLWKEVITERVTAIMPYTVLIEVVAAIRRRTGQKELAQQIKNELLSMDALNFVVLDPDAALDASDIAIETGLRGMDAVVIQTAKEYSSALVSLDMEMMSKASGIVRIKNL